MRTPYRLVLCLVALGLTTACSPSSDTVTMLMDILEDTQPDLPDAGSGQDVGPDARESDLVGDLVRGDQWTPDVPIDDFGSPCDDNNDCESSICVEVAPGVSICTVFCIEECPDGFECKLLGSFEPDPIFACLPEGVVVAWERLCDPCDPVSDLEDCGLGGTCELIDPDLAHYCLGPCTTSGECPEGFLCQDALCRPESASCECRAELAGMTMECSVINDTGECFGLSTCEGVDGWGPCDAAIPAPESCNGLDDDCDGEADEDFPELDTGCDGDDQDLCQTGTWTCTDEGDIACIGDDVNHVEQCNNYDDDCDGETDEDWPELGLPCDGPDDDICALGVSVCSGDGTTTVCAQDIPVPELCNQIDDDCDDLVDEDWPLLGQPCDGEDEDGCALGTWVCADDEQDIVCQEVLESIEVCNGVDDDCDGLVDEGFPDFDADGLADCVDEDDDGDLVLDVEDNCLFLANEDQVDTDQDGEGDACDEDDDDDDDPDVSDCEPQNPNVSKLMQETCNGIDDDCDLLVDEGFDDTDADGFKDCVDEDDDNDGAPDEDDCAPLDKAIHPGAPEVCNGIDDNCDGGVDEGFEDTDGDGSADCVDDDDDGDLILDSLDNCPKTYNPPQTNSDSDLMGDACDPDDDNDGAADGDDCQPTDPAIHPGAPEACNGIDDNCSGNVDEGFADTDMDGQADCIDEDDDDDGLDDGADNCPLTFNPGQANYDADLLGNACDPDDDNDGVDDDLDCKPLDETIHPGAEELCNGVDDDCNDVVDDPYPDTDGDGEANCVDDDDDGDGVPDSADNCPLAPNPGQDNSDTDLLGDACDDDDDNDGVEDELDCQPTNPAVHPGAIEECNGVDDNCDGVTDEGYPDTNGDGIKDCIADDDDGDGIPDGTDNCPLVPNPDQVNSDSDLLGNACDDDDDNDGDPDSSDCAPTDASRHHGAQELCNGIDDDCDELTDEDFDDTDGDGMADCLDPDDDNDGVTDLQDNCPLVANSDQLDTDGDGFGNVCDDDDDNDGDPDETDCAPEDDGVSSIQVELCNGVNDNCDDQVDEGFVDTDADGQADCIDEDDDNDSVPDPLDNCPLVANANQFNSDSDLLGDACDDDDDNDGDPDETDCAPTNPQVHHGAEEICGNDVDEDCDDLAPQEEYYVLPLDVINASDSALEDGVVRITITQMQLLAHIGETPNGLRAYLAPTEAPYAQPYVGLPLHVEHQGSGSLILWLRLAVPAQSTETVYLYYGPGSTESVADGDAVFDFFEAFDAGSLTDWSFQDNYSGTAAQVLSTSVYHSADSSLNDYLQASGGCQSSRYAYSYRTFQLPSTGLHQVSLYARSAACSGCTMYARLFLDDALVHNVYNPGPALSYYTYQRSLSQGGHQVKVGMYTTKICSGTFTSFTDDIMVGRTVSPAPSATFDLADEDGGGCL